jgi:hypothetical protein
VIPSSDTEALLSSLRPLPLADLRAAWRKLFHRRPASGLTRTLLIAMLAYQHQAQRSGDLDPTSEAFLERISRKLQSRKERPGRGLLVPALPMNTLQPGTVFVREWNGRQEVVTVVEGGFLWAGSAYPTLSGVACAITGSHWNGWRFFGLREREKRDGGRQAKNSPIRQNRVGRTTTSKELSPSGARRRRSKSSCDHSGPTGP